MKENDTYETLTGTTCFTPTIENTNCTGGTIADIYIPSVDNDSTSKSYVLTLKELRSCDGFENVPNEQAEEIIGALYQLSSICYRRVLYE